MELIGSDIDIALLCISALPGVFRYPDTLRSVGDITTGEATGDKVLHRMALYIYAVGLVPEARTLRS